MVVLSVLCAVLFVAVAVLAFNVWYLNNAVDRHFSRLEADYVAGLKVDSRLRRLERHTDELWLEVEALHMDVEDSNEKR